LEVLRNLVTDALLDLNLGERVLRPGEHLLQPLLDVDGLEDLDLALEAEIRRVARHIRDLARRVDPAEELRDLRHATGLDDALQRRPVLARELARPRARVAFVHRLDLDPRRLPGTRDAHAHDTPVQSADDGGLSPASDLPDLLDLGDGANAGVPAID